MRKMEKLLDDKYIYRLQRAYLNNKSPANTAAYVNIRRTAQHKLRDMQNNWLSQKA